MSLDDEANIIDVEGHQGPHPEEYHVRILRQLLYATRRCQSVPECREALVKELLILAKEIATPGTPLNRLVTQSQ